MKTNLMIFVLAAVVAPQFAMADLGLPNPKTLKCSITYLAMNAAPEIHDVDVKLTYNAKLKGYATEQDTMTSDGRFKISAWAGQHEGAFSSPYNRVDFTGISVTDTVTGGLSLSGATTPSQYKANLNHADLTVTASSGQQVINAACDLR